MLPGQSSQEPWPGAVVIEPAAQSEHTGAPPELNLPASHVAQLEDPGAVLTFPEAQDWQATKRAERLTS